MYLASKRQYASQPGWIWNLVIQGVHCIPASSRSLHLVKLTAKRRSGWTANTGQLLGEEHNRKSKGQKGIGNLEVGFSGLWQV
jgi:hypothetical protein